MNIDLINLKILTILNNTFEHFINLLRLLSSSSLPIQWQKNWSYFFLALKCCQISPKNKSAFVREQDIELFIVAFICTVKLRKIECRNVCKLADHKKQQHSFINECFMNGKKMVKRNIIGNMKGLLLPEKNMESGSQIKEIGK